MREGNLCSVVARKGIFLSVECGEHDGSVPVQRGFARFGERGRLRYGISAFHLCDYDIYAINYTSARCGAVAIVGNKYLLPAVAVHYIPTAYFTLCKFARSGCLRAEGQIQLVVCAFDIPSADQILEVRYRNAAGGTQGDFYAGVAYYYARGIAIRLPCNVQRATEYGYAVFAVYVEFNPVAGGRGYVYG